jgi:RimJ/RimL family protein N-acetyltransferase
MRIAGERVILRDRQPSDFADLARWMRPGLRWQRWDTPWEPVQPGRVPDPRDLTELLAAEAACDPRRRMAVDTVSGKHIGQVSWYWVDEGCDWADLSITVYEDGEWSQGYGTEAFALWTDYLFSQTDWVRVGFGTWSANHRMIRVGERLGFQREATFRNARLVEGTRYDAVRYGLLRETWEHSTWQGCSSRETPLAVK